ncbi:hypothetical protein CALCODRAFT_257732 [Calocera cornea HHB12733]|uniref:RING-type domain-containing protein n=1 Tax=Calocera cornea HHB12733 TaxID=1353952 RepID=A0A165GKP9_9BASI|nr:hypothetical protein CALCODRAFT_257732 [Calocera cornea HHB12733]
MNDHDNDHNTHTEDTHNTQPSSPTTAPAGNSTTQPQPQPQPQPPAAQPAQPAQPASAFSYLFPSHITFHFPLPTFTMAPAPHPPHQPQQGEQPATEQLAQPTNANSGDSQDATPRPVFGPELPPHPTSTPSPIAMPMPDGDLSGSPGPSPPTMPGAMPSDQPQQQQQQQPQMPGAHAHTWQVPGGMVFTFFVAPAIPIPAGAAAAGPQAAGMMGPEGVPLPGQPGQPPPPGQQQQPQQQPMPTPDFFLPFLPFFPPFFGPPPQMQEKEPDYARSSLLMRALEVVDEELVGRMERVQAEDARCAVCFERLGDAPGTDEEPASQQQQHQGQSGEQQQQQQQHRHQEEVRRNRIPPLPFPSSTALALPCHHAFHAACLFPWLAQHTTCPTCRFDLDPSSLTLSQPAQPQGERYRPYPSSEARKQANWALPAGPSGLTLRESVREKEHAQGWTCADPSCIHLLPNPAYAQEPGREPKADQIHLLARLERDAEPACEHAWHPACLVGAVRSLGGAAGGAGGVQQATAGVEVACPMCRAGVSGWVDMEAWDVGVREWEEV